MRNKAVLEYDFDEWLRYVARYPALAEPRLPVDRFLEILAISFSTGEWHSGGFSTVSVFRDFSHPTDSAGQFPLMARRIFADGNPAKDGTFRVSLIAERPVQESSVLDFFDFLSGFSVPIIQRSQDILFDGGDFLLRSFVDGTSFAIHTADPPDSEDMILIVRRAKALISQMQI